MKTLINLLKERVQASPDKIIYRYWQNDTVSDALSFATLDRSARATAAHLHNTAPVGERVLLLLPQSLYPMTAFFACLYSGMAAVPMPIPLPGVLENRQAIIKRYLENAESNTILTLGSVTASLTEKVKEAGLEKVHWINMDEINENSADEWKEHEFSADIPALVLYTSGSTRQPRGIIATHENLSVSLEATATPFQDVHDFTTILWTPLHNATGLLVTHHVLGYDATQIFTSPQVFIQKPVTWLKLISDFRASMSFGATFAFRLCVDAIKPEEREGLDLSCWKAAMTGGEPVRLDVLQQFAKTYEPYGFSIKSFIPVYGMSEAMGVTQADFQRGPLSVWAKSEALEQRQVVETAENAEGSRPYVSCGRPLPGYRLFIVNPETRRECTPGQIGEIWISGPAVAQGYWKQDDETNEVFHAHLAEGEGTYLRSGDLRFLKDGELYITGRLKDVIIVHGRNFYAVDVEAAAIGAHPAMQPGAAAVFGVTTDGEEKVVLMQEIRPGQDDVNVEDVSRQIGRVVSEKMKIPLYAIMLVKAGSLPRTPTGKIQRYVCRNRYLEAEKPPQK